MRSCTPPKFLLRLLVSSAMPTKLGRRGFLTIAASAGVGAALPRFIAAQAASAARADVGAMERERVLAEATDALKRPIETVTSRKAPRKDADPHEFYSELTFAQSDLVPRTARAFRDHATLVRQFSNTVAMLTAAYVLTRQEAYALRAGQHLYAWFVQADTRMNPQLAFAGYDAGGRSNVGSPAGVADGVPLAEIARAMSFLVDTAALSPPDIETTHRWFAGLLDWMNTAREPVIAREAKDHSASAWLLMASAVSRSLRDSAVLDACTHRFRKPTLRNQINAGGTFPREITTAFPFRNTLLNFELLCASCQLLSTSFDPLWQYELEDGPGMRAVAALLFPVLRDPGKWPYVADPLFFHDLPGRRAGMLFAGRAFGRPEYVELWHATPAPKMDALPEPLASSFVLHEPLLWTARAAHGL